MIPKDDKIREAVESINRVLSNSKIEIKSDLLSAYEVLLDLAKEVLAVRGIWPKKKYKPKSREYAHPWEYHELVGKQLGHNSAIDECKKAAMKGCPCCGVARIVEVKSKKVMQEKQKAMPTVEEIEKLIEKTRLQIRKTGYLMEEHKVNKAIAETVQQLIKSNQE